MLPAYKILSTKLLSPSLTEKAKQQGLDITGHPFISIQPVTGPQKEAEIMPWLKKRSPFYAVFTSANAVNAIAGYLREGTEAPAWKIFCIAGKTSHAVAACTASANILETAEYGEELARKIISYPMHEAIKVSISDAESKGADTGIAGVKEVVFFCGNRRRDELPSLLRQKGIIVHEIVVYHTHETPVKMTGNWDGILFFSPSAVNSFFSSNTIDRNTICFAIGRTTAESIARHTGNTIITSNATAEAALIKKVEEYFNNAEMNR